MGHQRCGRAAGGVARKRSQVGCFANPLRPCLFDKATSPAEPGEDLPPRRADRIGLSCLKGVVCPTGFFESTN